MEPEHDITVVIAALPAHAERSDLLAAALRSVINQELQPASVIVSFDHLHEGAAATKNRGLMQATTEWVAFLDDDDEMYPEHLRVLREAAFEEDADVVYSMPYVTGQPRGLDPMGMKGAPFDAAELRKRSYIQTTSLVRTQLAQEVGGFQRPPNSMYDDWGFFLALLDAGAEFYHLPHQTFLWRHWGHGEVGRPGNTSGDPLRW